MTYDKLDLIIEGICYAYDYDSDSHTKAQELKNHLQPLSLEMNPVTASEALYGIMAVTLDLIKELECQYVQNVEKNSKPNEDLIHTILNASQQK